ncbi:MAG: lipoate protein ligase C-terminal domain-containing protein [Carnobacterium sp.]
MSDVEKRLEGIKYDRSEIEKALEDVDVQNYFGNIEKEDLLNLIY